ncbi:FAD-dependent oxidoreductase [Rhodococcus sp. D2-41]|uniref:FAD-dependent oxidoreductase n=1 Tax=Speluncibacter jeojiensis TaxID=2710754 RepID=A0A9X4M261_9ACTN|nr:FAD-dependent oxidoreductase [Rhodococcus sp. D2-41]MDG3008953.1 FAD-dependent oxidoreductase [Rhodococcus sp. D2-41]MDG3015464.1 FAD-dependent oxidoreductase [Corynebacteriales bacterium D3-21]
MTSHTSQFKHSVHPVAAADVAAFDHETDVLVVGYGCAGAAAALEASAAGAQVTILERASGPGGSSALSGGEIYLGGGTPIQSACGFTDTAEDMATYLIHALGPNADEEKIRLYSEQSTAHYDWLVARGVPFKGSLWDNPTWVPPTDDGLMWMGESAWPYNELAAPAARGHRVQSDGFGGKVLMDELTSSVTTETSTEVHTDTRALRLVVDDTGRVCGVIARRFGTDHAYRARLGVVLTTGGFVDNDAMLEQHAPELLGKGKVSNGGDDGLGIVMAQAARAAVRRMSTGQVGIQTIPGFMARGMVVNGYGQRFINEDVYPGLVGIEALFRQDMRVWVVLDEQAYEQVPEDERWGLLPTYAAETVADLEKQMGLPENSLQHTVAEYNRHAGNGEDPWFHKSARWLRPLQSPFAAIDVRLGMAAPEGGVTGGDGAAVFTLGGLVTDVDGRVYDLDGAVLPGLYAAGRASSGLHGGGYISGTSLGPGTFFGRRAGRAAATRE